MFAEDQANYAGQFTKYGVETERLESSHVREAEPYAAKQDGRFDSSTSFRNLLRPRLKGGHAAAAVWTTR